MRRTSFWVVVGVLGLTGGIDAAQQLDLNNGWKDDGPVVRLKTPTDQVGVGTTTPAEKLSVVGTVESTSGGFKFPDGSLQTRAAGIVYTRWGRTTCPATATLLYAGYVGGSHYTHGGSGGTVCLSDAPTWASFSDLDQNGAHNGNGRVVELAIVK